MLASIDLQIPPRKATLMGGIGRDQLLVRAVRYDTPEELGTSRHQRPLPAWYSRRVTEYALYADGTELIRTGWEQKPAFGGRIQFNDWRMTYGDQLATLSVDQYCDRLIERRFTVRKARASLIQAAAVLRSMRQNASKE